MNQYKQEQAKNADQKRNAALKEMRALLKAGKRVAAVKAYRAATGCSLKQAMDEVARTA